MKNEPTLNLLLLHLSWVPVGLFLADLAAVQSAEFLFLSNRSPAEENRITCYISYLPRTLCMEAYCRCLNQGRNPCSEILLLTSWIAALLSAFQT